MTWPLVVENDDGIRPAGRPDTCFYCNQKIGQPHAADCVIVQKTVRLRFTIDLDIEVPHSWDADKMRAKYLGTWCASNLIVLFKQIDKAGGCLCDNLHDVQFVREVDPTPTRKVKG